MSEEYREFGCKLLETIRLWKLKGKSDELRMCEEDKIFQSGLGVKLEAGYKGSSNRVSWYN